ncbi:hypothetical protein SELMODRAFT_109583 [Selaginella moellendorffii]|uniref:Neprosin PEP catalytic domain-containing protein n=1 Tax=Selaginella moellendorffii TaxID=88036 RepID=D8S665_SELML|nr:hypothetical protein SELMODRAFT_109583 [Selaginella moellendorffii]
MIIYIYNLQQHAGYSHILPNPVFGMTTTTSLWQPDTESNNFSLSQFWVVHLAGQTKTTLEAGWQVFPSMYGNNEPHLFVYWTADDYQHTGCYNLECPGFVQVSNKIVPGATLRPASQHGGPQTVLSFLVYQDPETKNWWLRVEDEYVGYWPGSLVPNLANGATHVDFGGEVFYYKGSEHTTTQMGSGEFPEAGFKNAAYHRDMYHVLLGNDHALHYTLLALNDRFSRVPSCYRVGPALNTNGDTWKNYFFFGGPGRNPACP